MKINPQTILDIILVFGLLVVVRDMAKMQNHLHDLSKKTDCLFDNESIMNEVMIDMIRESKSEYRERRDAVLEELKEKIKNEQ